MNRFALKNGLAQSDFDFANFKALQADLSGYAGANIDWNGTTKQFDAVVPTGGGGSGIPGVFKDVTQAPYNAAGNGTTDDTVAIQTAINDVFNAGGGVVYFPRPSDPTKFYLCNGVSDPSTNSILKIPLADALTMRPRYIELRGEIPSMWGTYNGDGYATTLLTTRNNGTGTAPAFLAGGLASYFGTDMNPRNQNQVKLCIKNLRFSLQDNTTIWGLRLDSVGMAILEDVSVLCGATINTHGAIGIYMPRYVTMSQSQANRILVFGFDTALAAGEMFTMGWAYLSNSNVGFLHNGATSGRIHMVCDTCTTGIKILGTPPLYAGQSCMDIIYFHERNATSRPFTYDIDDSSNTGGGIIRYAISQVSSAGYNMVAPVINGGANINIFPYTGKQLVTRQPTYATPTTLNQVIALLQAAGLCA